MCGTYHREDDHLRPDLEATETDQRLVARIASSEGVTESLKRRDHLACVGAMNSIRIRAEEIVTSELIYS